MGDRVLSPQMLAYYRGEKRFRDGREPPPRPADDDPCTSLEAIEWIGWMMGRAEVIMKRSRTMKLLGVSED